jgi:TRAP-type C4-dicarboxylate transport system permease small subunit
MVEMKERVAINNKGYLRFRSGVERFVKIMAIIASCFLGGMMLLTLGDVVGRYFFNRPILGTWELIGLMLVFAGTWGFAYAQVMKAHIRVDILLNKFPPRIQAFMNVVSYLAGTVGFALITWQVFFMAKNYMVHDYVTDTLGQPIFPYMLGLCIGAGLITLVLLLDVIESIAEVLKK